MYCRLCETEDVRILFFLVLPYGSLSGSLLFATKRSDKGSPLPLHHWSQTHNRSLTSDPWASQSTNRSAKQ